jgi:hypothetical protein
MIDAQFVIPAKAGIQGHLKDLWPIAGFPLSLE